MNSERHNKFESNQKYFTISVYAVIVILIGAVLIRSIFIWDATKQTFHQIFSMLSPFLAGAFIAFVLNPLVNTLDQRLFGGLFRLKKNGFRYFLSVLLTYTFMIGLIVLFFLFLLPEIWQSLKDLWPSLVSGYEQCVDFLLGLESRYPDLDFGVINSAAEEIGKKLFDFTNIKNAIMGILPVVFSTSVNVVKWIVNAFIALVVSLYLLWDRKLMTKGFRKLSYAIFPKDAADFLLNTCKVCGQLFSGFISGKAIDSAIIGVICYFLMQILAMPSHYILLISVVVGVTNMIPYFGPYMGGILGGIIILMVNPGKVLIFAIMILALQQFDGLVLGPKILGDSIGIRPVWIIFSVTIGGAAGGVIGMFLGVPIFASIVYIVNCFEEHQLKKKGLTLDEKTGQPS